MSKLPPAAKDFTEGLRRNSDTASIAIAGVVYLASVVALLLSAMTVPVGTDLLKLAPPTVRLILFVIGALAFVYWYCRYNDAWFAVGYKISSVLSSSALGNLLGILAAGLTAIGSLGFFAGIATSLSVGRAAPSTIAWLLPMAFGVAGYSLFAQYAKFPQMQGFMTGLQVIAYMLPVTLLLVLGRTMLRIAFWMFGSHQ